MKRLGVIAGFLCLSVQAAIAGDPPWDVSLSSSQVFQGGVVKINVSGSDISGVKGSVSNKELLFFLNEHGSYSALLGVDLEEKSSTIEIIISARNRAGEPSEKQVVLRVREKAFPKEEISVPVSFDRIDEATRKRIEREQARLARLWTVSSSQRLWEGGFLIPVPGEVTSRFGLRRVVNGQARAPHSGVDFRAPLGTEIIAANHGRVALRDDFFFSGRSIVLDHGGGLYTEYFHLSEFRVGEGQQVRKGDLIGLAGMTGRVTGPNLHWAVRLNGARVDPFQLLETIGSRQ